MLEVQSIDGAEKQNAPVPFVTTGLFSQYRN